jgi:GxxExxY protein
MTTDEHGFKHGELTETIIGVFYDVYNELGHGFLESVYEEAMFVALVEAGLRVGRQIEIPVWFRRRRIGDFKADLLINDVVMLELKAARHIDKIFEAQLLHCLRATPVEVKLLFNFVPRAEFRRLCFDNHLKTIRENLCKSVAKS